MTDDEMRIAIAEACGWEHCHMRGGKLVGYSPCKGRDVQGPYGRTVSYTEPFVSEPPDYLNDLNAMHEAEKTLRWCNNGKRDLTVNYTRCIYALVDRESNEQFSEFIHEPVEIAAVLLRAPARQRAEAFLKTIGKCKND